MNTMNETQNIEIHHIVECLVQEIISKVIQQVKAYPPKVVFGANKTKLICKKKDQKDSKDQLCSSLNLYEANVKSISKIQKVSKLYINRLKLSDAELWDIVSKNKNTIQSKKKKIEYLLNEYGTREPCNRFDVGNCIEYIIGEIMQSSGLSIKELPNAKRIDMYVFRYGSLSIKYSSSGDITLHNSNGAINKDEHVTDFILLTLDKLYLITNKEIQKCGIDLSEYTKNTGDSFKVKRSLLREMRKKDYPFVMDFVLDVDRSQCKNRLTSKTFYERFTDEFDKLEI